MGYGIDRWRRRDGDTWAGVRVGRRVHVCASACMYMVVYDMCACASGPPWNARTHAQISRGEEKEKNEARKVKELLTETEEAAGAAVP